ncbi:MAG: molybdopterin-dependent oxidoreductase, partial [Pyrobaculum sp.]
MTSLTRRGFVKIAAIGLAALPVAAQLREARGWQLGQIGGKELTKASIVPVICPYCSIGCSIDMYTDGSRITWSSGSLESPINAGTLCPKGKAAFQLVDSPKRVLYPMVRTGPKPKPEEILSAKSWDELLAIIKKYPPQWRTVSWDEAFRYIAQRIKEILDEYRGKTGAPQQKDGFYYVGRLTPIQLIGTSINVNEEGYLTSKLAAFLGSSNVDSQYRKCHSSTVASLAATYGWGIETASQEDLHAADIVLFFSSPAEAHPVSFYHFLEAKKKRGTILITLDPRYSRTAMLSDLWVPFRSGTETAIFLYILHYAFFERQPPIDQLEEFKRLKDRWNITDDDLEDLKELLREYDVTTVSKITGTPEDLLKAVASLYVENSGVVSGHKKHGVIQWAMGMTQHTNATINIIRSAAIVQLLLGNVGYPGGGAHPFRGHSNVQGCTDVQGGGMGALPGYHAPPANTFIVRLYQDWKLQGMPDAWSWEVPQWARERFVTTAPDRGKADLSKILQVYTFYGWRRMELMWGLFCGTDPEDDPQNGVVICDFPFGTGSSEITVMRRALGREIRAMIIFGENMAVTNPNAKLVMAALSSLDLLVVSDIFETETAWFADVLLPAASFAEKEGTRTNTFRTIAWTWRVVEPRGMSRPDYWIAVNLFKYLRRAGAIQLPSEVYGKREERVMIRRGGKLHLPYVRPLRPDYSWDYSGGTGSAMPTGTIESEVNPRIINKEINFAVLIYQGIYDPIRDEFTTMRRKTVIRKRGQIDGLFSETYVLYKDWAWTWPMNVKIGYNYDGLKATLGTHDVVIAGGREWVVTGESGEWVDEFTGEYVPAFIPGHNFWVPRSFKRRLSGVADLYGGADMMKYIRTGQLEFLGKLVTDEGLLTYDQFVAKTGMKYLWANDTLYWDQETTNLKAALRRPFFKGDGWRRFEPKYEEMRKKLRQYYQQTGSLRDAVLKVIEEMDGWYSGYNFQWPIHTEPAESPDLEMAIMYPTIAWTHSHNLDVLREKPDIVKDKPVGVVLEPKELEGIDGVVVVMTSHRTTEHFHSGIMTRNSPLLVQLVPEPYAIVPESLAARISIKSGDYVTLTTARGSAKLKALVTKGAMVAKIGDREVPVVNVTWSFSFAGEVTGV